MKADEILTTAAGLTSGDRAGTHGDMTANHQCIALVWNGYLTARESVNGHGVPLHAHDVANMMELLKVARRLTGSFNIDDYVDGAGYAAVAGQIRQEQPNP